LWKTEILKKSQPQEEWSRENTLKSWKGSGRGFANMGDYQPNASNVAVQRFANMDD